MNDIFIRAFSEINFSDIFFMFCFILAFPSSSIELYVFGDAPIQVSSIFGDIDAFIFSEPSVTIIEQFQRCSDKTSLPGFTDKGPATVTTHPKMYS